MRIRLGYPAIEDELRVLKDEPSEANLEQLKPVLQPEQIMDLQKQTREIEIDERLTDYLMDIVQATRNHPDLLVGASPRAALALQRVAKASAIIAKRNYCLPDDIKHFVLLWSIVYLVK